MSFTRATREWHRRCLPACAIGMLLLAACSGTTGPSGPSGSTGTTGSPGPPAGGATLNVTAATSITGTITAVTSAGAPVVKVALADQTGAPVQGLPASDLGFAIAQLVPGENGSASQWDSYIYGTVNPTPRPAPVNARAPVPPRATRRKTQATVEAATSGTFVDHGDGTYQYTFAKDITKDPNVIYDA